MFTAEKDEKDPLPILHLEVPAPTIPIQRPLKLDTSNLSPISNNAYADHSPALSMKIKVPKRRYSQEDPLERMETPAFDKALTAMLKKTPSSTGTVLAMSGLFVCGIILLASGILVLILQDETAFVITGCLFCGFGVAMLGVCAILQWKNVKKLVLSLNNDLYFLSKRERLWKTMFEMPSELPLSN